MLVTNPDILRKLRSRFDLEPGATAPEIELQPIVIGITNHDDLLREADVELTGEVDPSATGKLTVLTVPVGYRYHLHAATFSRSTGSTLTINSIYVGDPAGHTIVVVNFTAAANYYWFPAKVVPLREGWTIQINVNAYGAGDKISSALFFEYENAY